jgi:hypothetical protein
MNSDSWKDTLYLFSSVFTEANAVQVVQLCSAVAMSSFKIGNTVVDSYVRLLKHFRTSL